MEPKGIAETMEGATVNWLCKLAVSRETTIGGSFIIEEADKYFNRFIFAFPDGTIQHYDKRHLFSLAGEHEVYKPGEERLTITLKGWRLCPMICYDLRFPVWSRNTDGFDLLIYVANWPKPRIKAWDTLLKARAIENMSYTIGVNRVGTDANGLEYVGHSGVYDSLGAQVVRTNPGEEELVQFKLDKGHLEKTREQLNFLEDRDDFTLLP
jgi:predicted amidohydrolase